MSEYQLSEESKAEFINHIEKQRITAWFDGDEFVMPSGQGKTSRGIVLYQLQVWKLKQQEIDQLKAKNAKLVHAVVNANEQTSHWAKQYWQGAERSAEYQAMLMNHPDQMAVECFKREKRIEKLKAELAQAKQINEVYQEDMAKDAEKIARLEKDNFMVSEKVRKVEWLLSNNSFDRTIKNCLKILRGEP